MWPTFENREPRLERDVQSRVPASDGKNGRRMVEENGVFLFFISVSSSAPLLSPLFRIVSVVSRSSFFVLADGSIEGGSSLGRGD